MDKKPTKRASGRFFQVGYVCDDLDRALRDFAGERSGESFFIIDVAASMNISDAPVQRIALAFCGPLNIEFIERTPRAASIYADASPAGGRAQFHHLGYLVDDLSTWNALQLTIEETGGAAMQGEVPGAMRYIYVDQRQQLGHYVEYIYLEDGGRALFDNVPRTHLNLAAIGT